jgi:valyl-tRNA synthetase
VPEADEPPPGDGWTQDADVLDTWFSSALWPFSTLGWPDDTADLRRFYPTDVLVTGYDILFFWVARMMMFGLYAMDGREPFRTVALTGLVRDRFGKKMSKSRGNVVDPLEWIDRYGADATRFALARGANPGTDVPIGEEWVAGSRNFCNKLWHATRFALLNGATVEGDLPPSDRLDAADRWILSRLQAVVAQVDGYLEDYEFAKACEALYHFAWDEVCDWYLELAKTPLTSDGGRADVTRRVLGHVLDGLLRLLHPVIPFVTDELWTALTGGESVVVAAWPRPEPAYDDRAAEARIAEVQRLVTEIRRFRADQGLRPSARVATRLSGSASLAEFESQIRSLTRLGPPGKDFVPTVTLPLGSVRVEFDLSGTVDVGAERRRLEKDLAAAEKELQAARTKLANAEFLAKAPAAVVERIRSREAAAEADLARLETQLGRLSATG